MSEPTTERDTCPECLRPTNACERCVGGSELRHDAYRLSRCQAATIANLRAALAELEQSSGEYIAMLKRELVEATRLREAIEAVEAVYVDPDTDPDDVMVAFERHVRRLVCPQHGKVKRD